MLLMAAIPFSLCSLNLVWEYRCKNLTPPASLNFLQPQVGGQADILKSLRAQHLRPKGVAPADTLKSLRALV